MKVICLFIVAIILLLTLFANLPVLALLLAPLLLSLYALFYYLAQLLDQNTKYHNLPLVTSMGVNTYFNAVNECMPIYWTYGMRRSTNLTDFNRYAFYTNGFYDKNNTTS